MSLRKGRAKSQRVILNTILPEVFGFSLFIDPIELSSIMSIFGLQASTASAIAAQESLEQELKAAKKSLEEQTMQSQKLQDATVAATQEVKMCILLPSKRSSSKFFSHTAARCGHKDAMQAYKPHTRTLRHWS